MQIGNLPSAASAVALGKAPRQVPSALSLLGMVCAGAAAAVAFLFLHGPAPEAPAIAIDDQEPVFMATNDAIFTAPHGKVATTRPAASTSRSCKSTQPSSAQRPRKRRPRKRRPRKHRRTSRRTSRCSGRLARPATTNASAARHTRTQHPSSRFELDRVMIAGALASVHPVVEQCAMQDVHGTVKVHMQVTPQGTVVDSEPRDTRIRNLGECVASAVKKAQFPHTQRGGTFTSSFAFQAAADAAFLIASISRVISTLSLTTTPPVLERDVPVRPKSLRLTVVFAEKPARFRPTDPSRLLAILYRRASPTW